MLTTTLANTLATAGQRTKDEAIMPLSSPSHPRPPSPILEYLVATIRNPATGTKDFRESLEKIGEYLALDIASGLGTKEETITTCLGAIATHGIPAEDPVLVTILRAGIPLLSGMQRIYPQAAVGFIGAMRDETTLKADISYIALPPLEGKQVILMDTMIATGGSIVDTIALLEKKHPKKIIVAGAIASTAGIEHIQKHYPGTQVYAAATDPIVNEKGYIVPGLGDAGDRAYGTKD